jgi:hypothetical protein
MVIHETCSPFFWEGGLVVKLFHHTFVPLFSGIFSNIGAIVVGHYMRRGRTGTSRPKKFNHWAKYLKATAKGN